jgi:uracil-DNA glycosylase family 4
MATDIEKIRKLEQMGLGPVWQRRALQGDALAVGASENVAADVGANTARSMPEAMKAADLSAEAVNMMSMDWDMLEESIRQCTRCGLCQGRTHAVPGIGDRKARWLFVGEGPGLQEDVQGEPFVGPAGKLLDNMLRALGLARGATTYITTIVKCRPVGADGRDRAPAADEGAACLPYLARQIDLIQPAIIVALGKTAAGSLLGLPADTSLASLRGKVHNHAGLPLIVTYHPADLLRQPADKGQSWRDLCLAMSLCNGR